MLKSQGRTLATGETYARKAQAEKAMASSRTAAGNAPVVDTTLAPAKTTPGTAATATKRAVKRTAKSVKTVAGATSGARGRKAPAKRR